jgi:N-acetylglucosamine repressor
MKFNVEQMASIEAEILKNVRSQPGISRVGLSRKLQISPSTVGNYTGRLITEGFLVESENVSFETGRPPTALQLNPDGGQFIGVDFEARNIMAMSVDFSDHPLKHAHGEIQESDSVAQIMAKIEEVIEEVLPEDPGQLLAIGIGVPGLVDPDKGIAVHYKYINHWKNVQLVGPLSKRFGVPVYLENTIRSMTLAELWFGQGRGVKDWLCIGIRSGIGAGFVTGGELVRGTNYRAGEIGRWRCPHPQRDQARFFADGNPLEATELQEVASVRALLKALEQARKSAVKSVLNAKTQPLVFADVVRAAQQRDALTTKVIGVIAETLGWAVSQLALTLNPERVILAGPLTLLGDTLLNPLRSHAERILAASGADVPEILNSTMGEYIGALGAAALAVHEWKPAR